MNDPDCSADDKVVSFTVKNMVNAPSRLPSDEISAFWTTSRYMDVCQYKGDNDVPYQITNAEAGAIEWNTVSINQDS
jgi:hypothetical protein